MARTSIYLNFMGKTEQAFNFYKTIFGTEFNGPVHRIADVPPQPGQPAVTEAEKNMVMHIELPILGGLVLMGTDALESMGHTVTFGNNISIDFSKNYLKAEKSGCRSPKCSGVIISATVRINLACSGCSIVRVRHKFYL